MAILKSLRVCQSKPDLNLVYLKKFAKPLKLVLLDSILAGSFIGFGCLALVMVKSDTTLSTSVSGILSGALFSIGLFAIVVMGVDLFTGNCLSHITLFYNKVLYTKTTIFSKIFKTLSINWIGNLIGISFISILAFFLDFHTDTCIQLADLKFSKSVIDLIISGVLCNLLVCTGVLLALHSDMIIGKFISVFLPVVIFVACGFEHSIADMFFIPFASNPDQVLPSLIFITLGNYIGGSCLGLLVGLSKTID